MAEGSVLGLANREIQAARRDLLCLAIVGDHLRWVLAGDGRTELSDWLTDAAAQWRAWADEVAKHLVSVGVAPDGRLHSLAGDTSLNWLPDGWLSSSDARRLLTERLSMVAEAARYRRSQATGADVKELLGAVCSGLTTQQREVRELTLIDSTRVRERADAMVAPDILHRGTR